MRILHVFKTYYPESLGGIEKTIHQLATGSRQRGADVDIFTLSSHAPRSWTTPENYRVHTARRIASPASTAMSVSAFGQFSALAAKADVVNYHFPWPFMDLLHFASNHQKPSVVTYHSDIVRQRKLQHLYRPLMHRFLRDADAIVATSPNYFETSNVLQVHKERVTVIPIGIGRPAMSEPIDFDRWSGLLGERFFLFVGAFRYYKGLHILLEAAHAAPFSIAIAGAGPIEAELKAQAARLGLTNVHFLGQITAKDKSTLLDRCCGVVFPSHLRSEAFGVSLVEGAAHGKPMISSEIGTGTSFVNINGETGLVVPPGDAASLRSAMMKLWLDADLSSRLGAGALRRYENFFTADRMVDRYLALYDRLIAKQQR